MHNPNFLHKYILEFYVRDARIVFLLSHDSLVKWAKMNSKFYNECSKLPLARTKKTHTHALSHTKYAWPCSG